MLRPDLSRPIAAATALACLAVLSPAPVTSQNVTPPGTIQPWQVAMTRQVTDVEVSPDGSRLAFLRTNPRRPLADESGPAWVELYVVPEPGAEPVPFVSGEVTVSELAWIDDERIAFLAKRKDDEHKSLYVIPARGGEARRVLEHDADIAAYSFDPAATRVAFLAEEEKSKEEKELEKKGFDQVIYEEDSLFTRLFVAEVDLSEASRAADAAKKPAPKRLEVEGSLRSVELSPTGDRVAVKVTPTPLVDDTYVAQRIVVLDLDGRVLAEIEQPGKLGDLAWSPDGRTLAMIGAADRNDPAEGRLEVVAATGGEPVDVLPGLMGHVAAFDWLDASTLVFVADVGTGTEVGRVGKDGSGRTTVLPAGELVVTGVDVATVAGGGTLALLAETASHPTELFTAVLPGGSGTRPQRVTESNDWLSELELARQEVVSWRARDGLELEGLLIHPLDEQPGRRYPLVMVVHGGPESHYRNGWLTGYSLPGQLAAARGFAVFYPNYRGSTGRGVEFSKLSQAAAAGPEFDDLIDGIDALVERRLVDRDRVGITGGSYGGYASAWGATFYSDRFAAAIPFVGISDAVSKVGTTDIPHEMFDVHHRKWLWQDWTYFVERSPIRWVERSRTPTLILHGEDDPRVHPSQSLELYRHLKVLGQAPVRLVLYPGEGHGNRKSASRFDYLLRTTRWMEHYLQGPGGDPPPYAIDYERFLPWAGEEEDDQEESEPTSTATGGRR